MNGYDLQALLREREKNSVIWWKYQLENRENNNLAIVSFPRRLGKKIIPKLTELNILSKEIDETNRKTMSVVILLENEKVAKQIIDEFVKKTHIR